MKFYLIERQSGQGCDYTIGCGVRVMPIEAPTSVEAREKALELAKRYWRSDSEYGTSSAELVTFVENLAPRLDARKAAEDQAEVMKAASEKEARERAEFERLREKYGK